MTLAVLNSENGTKTKIKDDPLFSVIVPIYDLPEPALKRCLMSLTDQDYVNKEIICVMDGPNEALFNIVKQFIFKGVKVIEIEHAGACAARNAGFNHSKGEIVSFFNSDYIAKPGMLRMWADSLLDNPDCGFAYGGYEYNSAQRHVYPSKPFDPFQLDVANYIDCGFPLWRKYVVEWDVNCKSLQDWDFWLRVVKTHNVKGHYLGGDYSFIAELPRRKGLSDDSHNNWIDRVNYIKNKNGIQKSDILVTSLGAPNHAVEIAKLIGADYRDDTFDKPHEYKALYMIGFYIKPGEAGLNEQARRLAIFKEKYPKSKRIIHWVGADIYWLRKFPYESLKYLAGALRQSCDYMLSENEAAREELMEYGIPTHVVPIPSYSPWEVKPLPEEFQVAIYLVEAGHGQGQSDFDKYLFEHTLSIVRGMPDIKFNAYGYGGLDNKIPNMKHHRIIKREDWPKFVYDNSALLRICRHDYNPMASNEFVMAGRGVITNLQTIGAPLIDTSGRMELNEWDKFSEGFNAYNWPKTKKDLMRAIRRTKQDPPNQAEYSKTLIKWLDKQNYISKIKGMCGL